MCLQFYTNCISLHLIAFMQKGMHHGHFSKWMQTCRRQVSERNCQLQSKRRQFFIAFNSCHSRVAAQAGWLDAFSLFIPSNGSPWCSLLDAQVLFFSGTRRIEIGAICPKNAWLGTITFCLSELLNGNWCCRSLNSQGGTSMWKINMSYILVCSHHRARISKLNRISKAVVWIYWI